MKYEIEITEEVYYYFTVEAENEEQAREKSIVLINKPNMYEEKELVYIHINPSED